MFHHHLLENNEMDGLQISTVTIHLPEANAL